MITTISTKTKKITVLGLAALTLSLGSCSDYLDVEPQDKLSGEQVYRNVYDADAAVIGIYGKFMALAEKDVILNEMRADLMTTTRNSSPYLKEISEHNVSADNPYANPKEFFVVIQNCNDALKNFDIMLSQKKFTQSEYNQRYADIGSIRSWVYLQLGIHYGNVPYITEPIETLEDVKDVSKHPRIPFNQLLDKLVSFTEALTYKAPYATGSSLVIDVDGYNTAKFFINKECLLGDLQLWKGNYQEAAKHYKTVMETSSNSGNDSDRFDMYRIKWAEVSTHEDLAVYYLRNSEQDATTLINSNTQGWRSIFGRDRDRLWNTEWIWSLPFENNFAPKNPFIAFFSKQKGQYLAQPSKSAISLWKNQTQVNGIPYDARGEKFSYNVIGGDPVIMKYLYPSEALATGLVENTKGQWFLYRAAKLHLRYAEAANRDNKYKIADAIINGGIRAAYTPDPAPTDVTNVQQTKLAFPYDFDARNGDFPYYRGNWHRGTGVRGRAYVTRANVVGKDSLTAIENNIIDEDALELAYEGNRWEDLVRVALRRNNPAFLADKVAAKLKAEGNPKAEEVRAKLMNVNNWYLPFNWQ
ncbi:RagB/SusD family nutrient uptake outer membrane protein [Flavobacterium gilvum]|uniref:RagB/SusD family protein n=1 Tax=Flavobacterium gilvum TaxID=1492737 RepID=A0AAC9N6P9_9FLAO|nr:RagB/SusD family nutrient uptake outer membrane protein [Flavobacterium gilvum]AOW09929.1 RagB/SusD family protein [Flavobacterium gilvum]KFC59613.1 RagB/SusD family protein [Flavobacterium gilvum]